MTSDYFKHPMWEIMEALEEKPPYRHIKLYPYQGKNFTVVAYDMHVEIQSTHENGETVHSLKRRAIMAMGVNVNMQATMSIHRLLLDPNDGTACPGSALDERADVHATGIRGGETLQITTKEGGARTGGGKTRATPRGGARTEGGAGAHGGHGEETWAAIAVLNDEGSSTTEKVVDATTGDTVTVKATYTTHQGDK